MKIFISGVAGFLGSHIAEEVLNLGHEVIGVDNLIGGDINNVPPGCNFHKIDLLQLEELPRLLAGVDVVYHAACTAYEGLSVFSPSLVVENTMQISVNMMSASIQAGVSRFVHCSSMARYGFQESPPFVETMVCRPQDPYGIAKYSAELCLRNLADVHGIHLTIAVPHNIIGPRQKYDDPFRNVASIMINMMLQGRQPVIYGDGRQIRCFSDIRDDVGILIKMIDHGFESGEVFNIGPDEEPVTILQLCTLIAKQLNFDLSPVFMPARPQEVSHATCSANKIREYFGYSTKYTLEESLASMIKHIEERGPKKFKYHLPLEIISPLTPKTWTDRLF